MAAKPTGESSVALVATASSVRTLTAAKSAVSTSSPSRITTLPTAIPIWVAVLTVSQSQVSTRPGCSMRTLPDAS